MLAQENISRTIIYERGLPTMSNSVCVTTAEAANYLGISQSWLRQARMRGRKDAPPFVRIGRAVRYRIQDLDDWLEVNKRR